MARNRIAADALNARYDFVMMVDNDIELPRDALVNLLEHDVDICLGYYLNRYARGERRYTTLYKLGYGAWEMYEDDELTLYVDIQEVTVNDDEPDEYVELYTKERTVNGKQ
jgi:hypothetical protein